MKFCFNFWHKSHHCWPNLGENILIAGLPITHRQDSALTLFCMVQNNLNSPELLFHMKREHQQLSQLLTTGPAITLLHRFHNFKGASPPSLKLFFFISIQVFLGSSHEPCSLAVVPWSYRALTNRWRCFLHWERNWVLSTDKECPGSS